MKALIISLLIAGCAHHRPVTTPQQRTEAIQLYLNGASSLEVAKHLKMSHKDARYVLRSTISSLSGRYQRDR